MARDADALDFLDGLITTLETNADAFLYPPRARREQDQDKLQDELQRTWSHVGERGLTQVLAGGWQRFLFWLELKQPAVAEKWQREIASLLHELAALNERPMGFNTTHGERDYQACLDAATRMRQSAYYLGELAAVLRPTPTIVSADVERMLADILARMEKPAAETKMLDGERTAVGPPAAGPTHAADFRSVDWRGTAYTFTAQQAACVKIWWEHWQAQTPDVSDAHLLEETETSSKLRHLFRGHSAWGTMIVQGATRGTHRLAGEK